MRHSDLIVTRVGVVLTSLMSKNTVYSWLKRPLILIGLKHHHCFRCFSCFSWIIEKEHFSGHIFLNFPIKIDFLLSMWPLFLISDPFWDSHFDPRIFHDFSHFDHSETAGTDLWRPLLETVVVKMAENRDFHDIHEIPWKTMKKSVFFDPFLRRKDGRFWPRPNRFFWPLRVNPQKPRKTPFSRFFRVLPPMKPAGISLFCQFWLFWLVSVGISEHLIGYFSRKKPPIRSKRVY